MSDTPARYLSYPTVLDVADFSAILDQCVEPDACYRLEGWVIRAMATELLANRAGRSKVVRHRDDGDLPAPLPLFSEA